MNQEKGKQQAQQQKRQQGDVNNQSHGQSWFKQQHHADINLGSSFTQFLNAAHNLPDFVHGNSTLGTSFNMNEHDAAGSSMVALNDPLNNSTNIVMDDPLNQSGSGGAFGISQLLQQHHNNHGQSSSHRSSLQNQQDQMAGNNTSILPGLHINFNNASQMLTPLSAGLYSQDQLNLGHLNNGGGIPQNIPLQQQQQQQQQPQFKIKSNGPITSRFNLNLQNSNSPTSMMINQSQII
ncbi:hypothetical protein MP228_007480 [Amoeboaphelidium protococcarum]|nr:hypothetical protein MP228_007480 [Amoeboaphelidium protococcarum]